ncbi:MAG: hypothetical protein U5N53_28395 [Mycobacterium sp.]|nr:hypothetical protein [Mycobacterium sp.]
MTYESAVAELEAERERELVAARRRTVLFALEAVSGDGFPRVCAYTTAHLVDRGLIERVPGDNLARYQLSPEGRIMLHANPAGAPEPEPDLFGGG